MSIKILFVNSSVPNYVADGLFHGLNALDGIDVVDNPRMNYMYDNASATDLRKTGTKGSTLYGLLAEDLQISSERTLWTYDIDSYDHIIFTDIFENCDMFNYIYKTLHPLNRNRISIVDGYDVDAMFPYFANLKNLKVRPWAYLYPYHKVKYFKREYTSTARLFGIPEGRFNGLSKSISLLIKSPAKLLSISMSIPEEHIEYIPISEKGKEFIDYNIDPDLNELFTSNKIAELGKWQPTFANQNDYYNEIRNSKFGITTRRAGWDCLRHYEYAAKGAILCFKDLDLKHTRSAPHELSSQNCIPYSSKEDLMKKLAHKSLAELEDIQGNQYEWIHRYTTKKVALRFLEQLDAKSEI